MNKKETRSFICDVRAEQDEQHGTYITGVPIVYEQRTDIGWYDEIIRGTALDNCDLKDVRFLVGHKTDGIPLARSRNNNENSTMQLIPMEDGLHVRVNLDIENNTEARALYSAVKRGDISGMSFMFLDDIDKDEWEDRHSDHPTRIINCIVRVLEVSAVTFPAYPQTSIQAASEDGPLDSARASLESALKREEEELKEKAREERRRAALDKLAELLEV